MELLKTSSSTATMSKRQRRKEEKELRQAVQAVVSEFRTEIENLDPYVDPIQLDYHLRRIARDYFWRIDDDRLLDRVFAELNELALDDNTFAVRMAAVFGSRGHNLGDVVMDETRIRNAMIGTLERNFGAIRELQRTNVYRFYNSITLLGEYYHRKKTVSGQRIHILGKSLLAMLTTELEQEITKCNATGPPYYMHSEFPRVLLEQITLNGQNVKTEHAKEINDLVCTMRRALITVPTLCDKSKAYLLMAIEVYGSNMTQPLFERVYKQYFDEYWEDPPPPTVPVKPAHKPQTNRTSAQPTKMAKQPAVKKSAPDAAPPQEAATQGNGFSRGSSTSSQNARTAAAHDKQDKRQQSPRTGAVPDKKTSATAHTSPPANERNVEVSENGKLVATVTADVPTKNTPPSSTPAAGSCQTMQDVLSRAQEMERLTELLVAQTASMMSSTNRLENTIAGIYPGILPDPGEASAEQQQQQQHQQQQSKPGPEGNTRSGKQRHRSRRGRREGNATADHHRNTYETGTSSVNDDCSTIRSYVEEEDSSGYTVTNGSNCVAHTNGTSSGSGSNRATPDTTRYGSAPPATTKPKAKSYYRDEEENLSWNAMVALDDDSTQNLNPHTQSFLSFLADK